MKRFIIGSVRLSVHETTENLVLRRREVIGDETILDALVDRLEPVHRLGNFCPKVRCAFNLAEIPCSISSEHVC